jgi:hypothetical protein
MLCKNRGSTKDDCFQGFAECVNPRFLTALWRGGEYNSPHTGPTNPYRAETPCERPRPGKIGKPGTFFDE